MGDKFHNVKFAFEEEHPESMYVVEKGGEGSGHHGHAGRPGKHGGSLPGKGDGSGSSKREEDSKAPLSKSDFKAKYPALYEAIDVIAQDNGGRINNKINVGFDVYDKMDKVNGVLAKLQGKTLGDILPKDTEWDDTVGFEDWADAIESFSIGDESSQDALNEYLGADGDIAYEFLTDVFDGAYSEVFYSYGSQD